MIEQEKRGPGKPRNQAREVVDAKLAELEPKQSVEFKITDVSKLPSLRVTLLKVQKELGIKIITAKFDRNGQPFLLVYRCQ